MADEFTATTVFAAVPVHDLDAAVEWYGRLFGRAPDSRPAPQIAEYYLATDRTPERGTLQLHADPERAGGGLATINLEDIAAASAVLADLGVTFDARRLPIATETFSAVTVGSFVDPDGNRLTLVQPHRKSP
jgi:glyoxylase I family protein